MTHPKGLDVDLCKRYCVNQFYTSRKALYIEVASALCLELFSNLKDIGHYSKGFTNDLQKEDSYNLL